MLSASAFGSAYNTVPRSWLFQISQKPHPIIVYNSHIFFCPQFPEKELNVPSPQPLLLIFSFQRWKARVCFSVNAEIIKKQKPYGSCKKLMLRWALYRRIVFNVQSPFLIFKDSTSTLLVHLLTFLFQLTKLNSISFWREKKRELKRKPFSPGRSLQPSAAHGMLFSLL